MPITRTLPHPPLESPAAARYALHTECAPVELSTRVLGVTVLRARFRPCSGHLRIDEDGGVGLSLDALTASVRTKPRLLARVLRGPGGLHANHRWSVRFECPEIVQEGPRRWRLPGTVMVGTVTRELVLAARLVRSDAEGIVLHARGVLDPPGPARAAGPLGRLLVANRLHVEIAGEFVR